MGRKIFAEANYDVKDLVLPIEEFKVFCDREKGFFLREDCREASIKNAEEILDKIIPSYIGGLINTAVNEAGAAESAARRTAMNAANKNASEMIDTLMLKFNRARQAIITQEITEIVSGAGD